MSARFPTTRLGFGPVRKTGGTIAIALCAVAGSAAIGPEANAQGMRFGAGIYYNEPDALVSPRSVVYRLQDRGFTEITRPRFDGTAYIIDATSPSGDRTRLFVDAREGDIIGRRRLEAPYYPSMRAARPGYGWTEEDMRSARTARAPEGLIPPAEVPGAPSRALRFEPDAPSPRAGANANPLGVNPESRARAAQSGRRTAKLNAPQRPAGPNASPNAPSPNLGKAQPQQPEAAPGSDTAKIESPKSEPVTPAANQPNPAAAGKPAAGTSKKDQAWKDPPADDSKRKVRVIDGATVVPGSGEAGAASAN